MFLLTLYGLWKRCGLRSHTKSAWSFRVVVGTPRGKKLDGEDAVMPLPRIRVVKIDMTKFG